MSILIAGDFFPGGRLADIAEAEPERLFGRFVQTIRAADLALLNLETPLCGPLQPIEKTGPALSANPAAAAFLVNAGFKLVTLANNHIFDFGSPGLYSTLAALDQHGVEYVGAGNSYESAAKPFLLDSNGKKLAIMNFAENEWSTTRGKVPGANPLDPVSNYQAIRAASQIVDHVIVVCHGGHEMHDLPSPRMRSLFRFFVEAGASAVVNHHTHCVSGYEVYQGAPIFYSLGNFLFDNPRMRSGPWTRGMAVELQIEGGGVDFKIHHFDQCTDVELFSPCDQRTSDIRQQHLDTLNEIISDDERLERSFEKYSAKQAKRYLRYLEPTRSRLLLAAQNRGLVPSLLSKRQRTLLLNLIRCEAHRELVIEILESDVGNPR